MQASDAVRCPDVVLVLRGHRHLTSWAWCHSHLACTCNCIRESGEKSWPKLVKGRVKLFRNRETWPVTLNQKLPEPLYIHRISSNHIILYSILFPVLHADRSELSQAFVQIDWSPSSSGKGSACDSMFHAVKDFLRDTWSLQCEGRIRWQQNMRKVQNQLGLINWSTLVQCRWTIPKTSSKRIKKVCLEHLFQVLGLSKKPVIGGFPGPTIWMWSMSNLCYLHVLISFLSSTSIQVVLDFNQMLRNQMASGGKHQTPISPESVTHTTNKLQFPHMWRNNVLLLKQVSVASQSQHQYRSSPGKKLDALDGHFVKVWKLETQTFDWPTVKKTLWRWNVCFKSEDFWSKV